MAVRAGEDLDRADRVDTDLSRFPQADARAERADRRRGRDAAGLDEGGEADSAQLALGRRSRLARSHALVVGVDQRLVERARVVADVIGHDDRRLVRERGDEVLAAEFGGVAAGFARGKLHQALDHEGRLGTAGAAIGVDRRRGGVDRIHLGVDRGDVVLARQQRRVEIGRHRRGEGGEIRAHVGERVDAHARHLARCVHRQLSMGRVVAAVRVGEERLGAVGGPLDRTVDLLGRPGADRLLGVDEDFRAEAAADVGGDHAQLVLGREADEGRQHQTRDMRVLARGVERHRVGAGIVIADRRAGLHRVRDQPVVDEVELGDMRGLGEGGVGGGLVAEVPVIAGVVGRGFVNIGAADSLLQIDHGRQHAVVDVDLLGRVARLRIAVGDDDRDGVADIAHLALRQRGMGARLHRRTILGMDHPAADQAADLVGRDVMAGKDGDHAGRGGGFGEIDGVDRGVRVRRTQEIGVRLARTIDVIDVAALAGDETNVFRALDGSAEACRAHVFLPEPFRGPLMSRRPFRARPARPI